jgi:hypothetical protein
MKKLIILLCVAFMVIVSSTTVWAYATQYCGSSDFVNGVANHCDYGLYDFMGSEGVVWWWIPPWTGIPVILRHQPNYTDLTTDLGMSVTFNGVDLYFFGDGHATVNPYDCFLPFGAAYNKDASNPYVIYSMRMSGTAYRSMTDYGRDTGELFSNHELALNYHEQPFWVPTGVVADNESQTMIYWYGKYINCDTCDSSNLFVYSGSAIIGWDFVTTFTDRKFIQIGTIIVGASENPIVSGEKGVLLYGTGLDEPNHPLSADDDASDWWEQTDESYCSATTCLGDTSYRMADMYLAYISFNDLINGNLSEMVYWVGPGNVFSHDIDDAVPVITRPAGAPGIGEFSVQKITPCAGWLLMTYVTNPGDDKGYFEYYTRIIKLSTPWSLPYDRVITSSDPHDSSYGYGQYIVPSSFQLLPSPSNLQIMLGYDRVVSNTPYQTAIVRSKIRILKLNYPGIYCTSD